MLGRLYSVAIEHLSDGGNPWMDRTTSVDVEVSPGDGVGVGVAVSPLSTYTT